MKMTRRLGWLMTTLSLLALSPGVARACECERAEPPIDRLHEYDLIIEGRVVADQFGEPHRPWRKDTMVPTEVVSFEVVRAWRDQVGPGVDVRIPANDACAPRHRVLGERWIIYARREDDGEYWDTLCSESTTEIDVHRQALDRALGPGLESEGVLDAAAPPPLQEPARGCSTIERAEPSAMLCLLLACGLLRAGRRRGRPHAAAAMGIVWVVGCRGTTEQSTRTGEPAPAPACAPLPDSPTGLIPYFAAGRWGFADHHAEVVITPRFDAVEPFVGGLARVRVGEAWGAVDRTGALRIEPRWAELGVPHDGLLWARASWHRVFVIDACGAAALPQPFVAVDHVGESIIAEREREAAANESGGRVREWALLDRAGTPLLEWATAPIVVDGPVIVRFPHPRQPAQRQIHDHRGHRLFDWRGELRFSDDGAWAIGSDEQGSVHLLDRRGHEPFPELAVTELFFPDPARSDRVWAHARDGWRLLDLRDDPPKPLTSQAALRRPFALLAEVAALSASELGSEWFDVGDQQWLFDIDGRVLMKIPKGHSPMMAGCVAQSWRHVNDELVTFDGEGQELERIPNAMRVDNHWALIGDLSAFGIRDVCSPGGREPLERRWDDVSTCAGSDVAITARDGQQQLFDLQSGQPIGDIGRSHRVFCDDGFFVVSFSEARHGASYGAWAFDGRPLAPMLFGPPERREIDGVEVIALPYFGSKVFVGLDGVRYHDGLPTPGRYPQTAERLLAPEELAGLQRSELEYMLLELFARHGYLVPEERRAEFLATDWYRPRWGRSGADQEIHALSPIEHANYELLVGALHPPHD